jgi:predicted amidohydrolase YtcJ
MLKEQAQRTPEGQWVRVVGGWNEYQFEERRLPTLEKSTKLQAILLLLFYISTEKRGSIRLVSKNFISTEIRPIQWEV